MCAASGTNPLDLDGQPGQAEALVLSATGRGLDDPFIGDLNGLMTSSANQELADMPIFGMVAANEGIQRFQPMDETLFQQEIQRAIDGRRRCRAVIYLQLVENCIGADRGMAVPNQLQHPPPDRGQADAALLAEGLRTPERIDDAIAVIMRRMSACQRQ